MVVSRWHGDITSRLSAGAEGALSACGANSAAVDKFEVPGAFRLPLVCLKAAESRRFDAVIALGVVIRGETPHFDHIAGQAAAGIMQASLQTGVPVSFGVITADDVEQAVARSGDNSKNKGYEAALAAVEMATLLKEINGRISPLGEEAFPHVV